MLSPIKQQHIFIFSIILLIVDVINTENESCHSFGPGRQVYPEGTASLDHKLHYTKAVSKSYA